MILVESVPTDIGDPDAHEVGTVVWKVTSVTASLLVPGIPNRGDSA
jgi:hypothetical protein